MSSTRREALDAANSDKALAESVRMLTDMRADVLCAVPHLLADLAGIGAAGMSEVKLRRFAFRLYYVIRYQRLCADADTRPKNQREAVKRINASLAGLGSKPRCELRALQRWLAAFREVQSDGLPAGWRGLVEPESKRKQLRPVPQHRGRPEVRQPESIAFFRSLYVDPNAQSVRACHRLTLAESRRRGWLWPESSAATRRWLRETEAGREIKNKHRLDGRGRRSKRRSTRGRTAIDAL